MNRPSVFAIIGGQRCGTTWLYRALDSHPSIVMAKPARPEPKFFLREDEAQRTLEAYLSLWPAESLGNDWLGEKSTSYIETPGVAARMKGVIPDLRLLALLRHPVERALSNYRFSRSNGFERLSFDDAVREEDARLSRASPDGLSAHPYAYARRGEYARMMESFDREFPVAQVHVMLFDDIRLRPQSLLAGVFDFLGLQEPPRPDGVPEPANASEDDGVSASPETLDRLFQRFEAPNRRLESRIERDLSHWEEPTPMIKSALECA